MSADPRPGAGLMAAAGQYAEQSTTQHGAAAFGFR